jgi:hypothetical protein
MSVHINKQHKNRITLGIPTYCKHKREPLLLSGTVIFEIIQNNREDIENFFVVIKEAKKN